MPVAPALSVSTGELLTRTLNGCRFSYAGSRTRQVPAGRSQVRLAVESSTAGCRLILEPLLAPLSLWVSRSGATTVAGGSGELVLTVAQNDVPSERSGLVTIMAETPRGKVVFTTVNVIQAPAPPPPPQRCLYTASTLINELSPAGESRQVILSADNALCEAPVIRNATSWQTPSFPGGLTAVIAPVSAGRWALTLTAPRNTTSLVRSGSIQLGRADTRFSDWGLVIVAQRGVPSATEPRLPAAMRVTGAAQQFALDVTSQSGECWRWDLVTSDGIRATGFMPMSGGINPIVGCGSGRVYLTTTTNTSGAARSTIVWLRSSDFAVMYDYAIVTQSSF